MNWPFILFFKACPYLILLKTVLLYCKNKNQEREREKKGKVNSYDCDPIPGSNKWQKKRLSVWLISGKSVLHIFRCIFRRIFRRILWYKLVL